MAKWICPRYRLVSYYLEIPYDKSLRFAQIWSSELPRTCTTTPARSYVAADSATTCSSKWRASTRLNSACQRLFIDCGNSLQNQQITSLKTQREPRSIAVTACLRTTTPHLCTTVRQRLSPSRCLQVHACQSVKRTSEGCHHFLFPLLSSKTVVQYSLRKIRAAKTTSRRSKRTAS